MEPTPTVPTPHAGQALVEYVRTQRQNAGYVFVGLAVLLLALAAFLAVKAFRVPSTPEKPVDKPVIENPLDPEKPPELPKSSGEIVNLKRGDYNVGWVGLLLGSLIVGTAGAWLLAGVPPATVELQRSEARVILLAVGGLLGTALILIGVVYFYRWSDSLVAWLDRGQTREARWVLIPILMVVLGAGLMFVAVQPARADERNHTLTRRLVYGSNFGLTTLLLVVVLIVANVLFSLRVPNKLDATETGFYSISDNTKQLLVRLDSPVTAYAILPDASERLIGDVRQLLLACQDSSDGKFKVKFVNPVADKTELLTLASKYPQLDLTLSDRRGAGAVLLAAGTDEKRHVVIPVREFFSTTDKQPTFVGEAKLFKELTLLADNQVKPVVYFTQSNGEMSIAPDVQAPDDQKATRLRAYLEKNYLEVRPLQLPLENPFIPEDAAVIVIAGPRQPFTDVAVGALRKYVNTPRGTDGKKGKVVVLAGAVPGPGGRGLMKTGLDELLKDLNVRIGEQFVYSFPTEIPDPRMTIVGFTKTAQAARQPIALAISKVASVFGMELPRVVSPLPGNPSVEATPLVGSIGPTWLESDRLANPMEVARQLSRNEAIQLAKNLSIEARPLGLVVTEGGAAKAVVFGSSSMVSDAVAGESSAESSPITFDLIGVSIDWLRDRPSVATAGIEAKKYREYQFPDPATVDSTRLLYLPLGLGLLTIVGLGMGVWVVRRK